MRSTFAWLRILAKTTVDNLRLDPKRRLVAQICPRWNRLQPWFELFGAFKDAA